MSRTDELGKIYLEEQKQRKDKYTHQKQPVIWKIERSILASARTTMEPNRISDSLFSGVQQVSLLNQKRWDSILASRRKREESQFSFLQDICLLFVVRK